MKLTALKKNGLVAIAAPAGPFEKKSFEKAVRLLKEAGFQITYRKDIFARHDYLAGTDQRRLTELQNDLNNPEVEVLLFARGGYGSQRLLPLLKFSKIHPKIVVGMSDLTVLLNYLWKKFKMPSLYGPLVAPHLIRPENVRRLKAALSKPDFFRGQPLHAKKIIRPGRAEGRLVGGCLTLVVATLGTPWEIETKGTILFLEDTHEEPYAVDRMLTQLEQAGKFKNVKGIVFGTFRQGKTLYPNVIEQVIREKFHHFKKPILWGLRFGHCPNPLIIPFGGKGCIQGPQLIITQGIL